MTERRKVLIVGVHTTDNLGDIAISQMISRLFEEQACAVERMDFNFRAVAERCLPLLRRNPESSHEGEHRVRTQAPFRALSRLLGRLVRALFYFPLAFAVFAYKARGCSRVYIGGGNLLMGIEYGFPVQVFSYVLFSRLLRKPVIFLCVGAGPLTAPGAARILGVALRFAQQVVCRDEVSRQLLNRDLGVPLSKLRTLPDPVLLWPAVQRGAAAHYDVVLNCMPLHSPALFRDGDGQRAESYLLCMVSLAAGLAKAGRRVGIVVTDAGIDLSISSRLVTQVEHETGIRLNIEVPASPHDLAVLLGSTGIVFSTRMHAAILALSQRVPAMSLCWQPKIRGLYSDLGLSECLVEPDAAGGFQVVKAHAGIARVAADRDLWVERIRECRLAVETQYRRVWPTLLD